MTIDASIIQSFAAEALSYLPEIEAGLATARAGAADAEKLQTSARHLHTIKGAAGMMGIAEAGALAARLKEKSEQISALSAADARHEAAAVLSELKDLAAMLTAVLESERDAPIADQLAPAPEPDVFSTAADSMIAQEEETDFELDEEMLEIFAEEAREHLDNINSRLTFLRSTPHDREALLDIRRAAHTLKGSAAIIGAKPLSSLAHHMEDLLDFLADNELAAGVEVFDLLESSTDLLAELAKGKIGQEIEARQADAHSAFEAMLAGLRKPAESTKPSAEMPDETIVEVPKTVIPPPEFVPESAAETAADYEPLSASALESIPTLADAPALPALPVLSETAQPPALTFAAPTITKEAVLAKTADAEAKPPTRSIYRVSLKKLDDLVEAFSELLSGRAVLEQRIADMEKQVSELQLSNNRLRKVAGKLEVDFEAGMLGEAKAAATKTRKRKPSGKAAPRHASTDAGSEFDDLELDRYTEFHQVTRELAETGSDLSGINNEMEMLTTGLDSTFKAQRHLIDEIQQQLMSLRMVPFNTLLPRIERVIAVTAEEENKKVELKIEGGLSEIDTQVLDGLVDPLLHLLRNAISHGIELPEVRRQMGKAETGRITLKLSQEGTFTLLSVSDDGKGIPLSAVRNKALSQGHVTPETLDAMSDEETLNLIFLPGLSTAAEVSEVSGRGVGMNIVQEKVARLRGTVGIDSELHRGTSFTIRLPMALSVTRVLMIRAGAQSYAFPVTSVAKIVEISAAEYALAAKEKILLLEGASYRLAHLNDALKLPKDEPEAQSAVSVILLKSGDKPTALLVDEILKTAEIVVKPLCYPLENAPEMLGASVMGDGRVIPVLDLAYLLKAKNMKQRHTAVRAKADADVFTVMVVDDSPSVRRVNSNLVAKNNWRAVTAKDGMEALEMLQTARELPNIILTDMEMPRMDGYELLTALKESDKLRDIPVIMITSRAGDKHRQKALSLGVSAYVVKPYEDAELIELIHRLTGS
jgi:chemosensory pili system protein ChpA (sensor histidine kinase/response regulator)